MVFLSCVSTASWRKQDGVPDSPSSKGAAPGTQNADAGAGPVRKELAAVKLLDDRLTTDRAGSLPTSPCSVAVSSWSDAGSERMTEADKFAAQLQHMVRQFSASAEKSQRGTRDASPERLTAGGKLLTGTEWHPELARRLRFVLGVSEESYQSSLCSKPLESPAPDARQSDSIWRSHDGHLVLKVIEDSELEAFAELLPSLVEHFEQCPGSLLCRYLGAYSVTVGGSTRHVLAMANVLRRPADEVFNMKGCTEDRWTDPTKGGELRDLNFWPRQLLLLQPSREALVQALSDDVDFLQSQGIMGYSMLLGITCSQGGGLMNKYQHIRSHSDPCASPRGLQKSIQGPSLSGWLVKGEQPAVRCDVQLGIINYLCQWKRNAPMVYWMKKATVGCFHEMTTEPPAVYAQRFCKYILSKVQVGRLTSKMPSDGRTSDARTLKHSSTN